MFTLNLVMVEPDNLEATYSYKSFILDIVRFKGYFVLNFIMTYVSNSNVS
jgi:hypothetical protein